MRLARAAMAIRCVLGLAVPGGPPLAYADGTDPSLQGRIFQSSDGALWIYRETPRSTPVHGVQECRYDVRGERGV
jgi:hypothetical protein